MSEDLDIGATAEVEAPSIEEKSIDDTIREQLQSLQSRDVAEEPVAEVKVEKLRDERGKFAKTTVEPTAEAPVDVPVDIPEVKAEAAPVDIPFPNSWKKEAAEAWAKADPVLRAEVARREADIHKGIEQYKQAAEFASSVEQLMSPYKQTIANLGVTPQVAIKELMASDHKLRYGSPQEKEMFLVQLAKNYGIDMSGAINTAQNTDPRVYELYQRNQYLEQNLQQQQQAVQQQQEQALNSEIANFAADPKNTHFETVKLHMAALLQAGQAKDLSDAYEQAIYANPATRNAVLQQQVQAAKDEAAKKAQAARMASGVNLRSTPSMPVKAQVGSMEDTLRDIYRQHHPLL